MSNIHRTKVILVIFPCSISLRVLFSVLRFLIVFAYVICSHKYSPKNHPTPKKNFFRFKNFGKISFLEFSAAKNDWNWPKLALVIKNYHKSPFKWSLGVIKMGFKWFPALWLAKFLVYVLRNGFGSFVGSSLRLFVFLEL